MGGGGGGGGWVFELFISEITASVLVYPVLYKTFHAYFHHFPPIFWILWYLQHKHNHKSNHRNLLTTYKSTSSQQVLSHISPMHSKVRKKLYQKLGAPWPLTRQHAIWWSASFRKMKFRLKFHICFIEVSLQTLLQINDHRALKSAK